MRVDFRKDSITRLFAVASLQSTSGESMAVQKNERRVFLWRVTPRPMPMDAPVTVTLDEIISAIKDSYKAGAAIIYISDAGDVLAEDEPENLDPKNKVYIADVSEVSVGKNNFITIMINRGDPTEADPAFINEKLEVRPVTPNKGETQGWSAHLVISKTETDGAYRACFEKMSNVSSYYADTLIRVILDKHASGNAKYTYKKNIKKNKKTEIETKTYRPHFAVRKVPSESIKEDLELGELSAINLIEIQAEYTGPDAPDVIRSIKRKLQIKPMKVDTNKILQYIEKLMPWAKKAGYNEIQFEMKDLPGGASASPKFALEQQDAAETLYVRSKRITDFDQPLERCYAKICTSIQAKMIELLSSKEP